MRELKAEECKKASGGTFWHWGGGCGCGGWSWGGWGGWGGWHGWWR